MTNRRRGHPMVLCAPSGTGKSTLVKRLMQEFDTFSFSVSYTTRAPREGEQDGVHYHFVDADRFRELADQGFFAEWAEVHGNFYGTPLPPTRELLESGRDILFDIDVQGARQLRESMPDATYVFLLPPSLGELERRLESRGQNAPEDTRVRLENARTELEEASDFDYLVVNDDLERAYDELRAVYLAGCLTPARNPGLAEAVLVGDDVGGRT